MHANEKLLKPWTFHPFELAIAGYQNSGKTTLLTKLVPRFGLDVAYVKRDAHRFSMDTPGKDTHSLALAGATMVYISDPRSQALLKSQAAHPQLQPLDFLEADALLVEGHKASPVPKLIMLDNELAILADPVFTQPDAAPPIAAIGPWPSAPQLPWGIPYFQRDQIELIADYVSAFWAQTIAATPVYGLVLSGGRSSRMGRDKAALTWHGEAELRRAVRLLGPHCSQVFVSCRADQAQDELRRDFPQIHDRFLDFGPLSGIMSAQHAHPQAAWLVLACDLPFLDEQALGALLAARDPFRFATAFQGSDDLPEPLCTIYEPKSRARFLQFLAAGYDCPRKLLINSRIALAKPISPRSVENVNEADSVSEVEHALRQ